MARASRESRSALGIGNELTRDAVAAAPGSRLGVGAPAVVLDDVAKSYLRAGRTVEALRPLRLSVEHGELAAIVGPNGAGKTTALKILATLVEPSSGRARVCGHDVVAEPGAVRRFVGASFGSGRSFYWRLTARQNLWFFGRLRLIVGPRIRDEIEDVAWELGLGLILDLPVRRLSRGALARLSIARAFLGRPKVLLLDEPFALIDPDGRELVRHALGRRVADGCAAVVSSHHVTAVPDCGRNVELNVGAGAAPARACTND